MSSPSPGEVIVLKVLADQQPVSKAFDLRHNQVRPWPMPPPSVWENAYRVGPFKQRTNCRALHTRRDCGDRSQWEVLMKLSAPIYRLKRAAKRLGRETGIAHHEALARIAAQEGFKSWSLLCAHAAVTSPSKRVFPALASGDMVLVGARPGHGKTLLCLELLVEAMNAGRTGVLFSLEYTSAELLKALRAIDVDPVQYGARFRFHDSEAISADYIIHELRRAPPGTLTVVDYLQALDQNREKPELSTQIQALKTFAQRCGQILLFIAQIDRSYDATGDAHPGIEDVRRPNPVDLSLFNKTVFLNDGDVLLGEGGT